MESLFPLVLALLTSAGLVAAGRRVLGLPAAALPAALGRVLEWVGLWVVLAVLNLAAGAVLVLLLRVLTDRFWSMYLNTDGTILLFSALQASAVQWWRAGKRDAGR